jgi:hypothetical protein
MLTRERVLDSEAITRMLEDVTCGPLSYYLSPRTDKPGLEQSFTLARILMNLSTGELRIADVYADISTET